MSFTTKISIAASSFLQCFVLVFISGIYGECWAGDWPGHLGPSRNGIASENEKVATQIASTPPLVWEIPAGDGYAGAAIAGGMAYLYDRSDEQDRVRQVSLISGKILWEQLLPASYRGGIDSDRGPRCVPTLYKESVILYSAGGDLSCLDCETGKIRWTRALRKEYQSEDGYFGAGSTPLIVGDKIIVNIGGKNSGIVAVALSNGKTLWKTGNYDASYASPILVQNDVDQGNVLVPTRLKTVLLKPDNGEVVGEIPFGSRGPTVNAATPISISTSNYFLTASYGIGGVILGATNNSLTVVGKNELLSSQYATPVFSHGLLYGSDGREDGTSNSYVCVNPQKSELLWTQSDMPICHSILIDKKLLVFGIDGRIWALSDGTSKWDPIWSIQLPAGLYRPLPAISDGLLVTRSVGSKSQWIAIRIDGR